MQLPPWLDAEREYQAMETKKTFVMGIAAWRFAPKEGGSCATAFQGAARGSEAELVGNVHPEPAMRWTSYQALLSIAEIAERTEA